MHECSHHAEDAARGFADPVRFFDAELVHQADCITDEIFRAAQEKPKV
jgi:hypothetical protein